MKIRRVTPSDKKELIRLLKEFERSETSLSEIQRRIRAYIDLEKTVADTVEKYLSQPEWVVFVADENGTLKAFISGEIREKKYRVYNKEGYVDGWFVEEDSQTEGVGKQLFEALVKEFKKAGCTHIGLDTHLENTKAIQIYEHMGFTKRLVTFFKPLKDLS